MKTASEVVHHLNETGKCIYDLSKKFGIARSTLYQRLKRLGYILNQENKWVYDGNPEIDPGDVDVISKGRMKIPEGLSKNPSRVEIKDDLNIHQALMRININNENVRTTISFQSEYRDKMKKLSEQTRLRLTDLYTLAIHELLEKYGSPK